ncbi:LolA family protein [Enemella sp. A6]|uniref:LolA family protein n=1 Tax=Enemella sp. A6 TaxID=3440152 RepID=UPI003EB8797E
MAWTQKHPITRWAVPAAAVAAIAAMTVIPMAGADPKLPPKSPEQLLVDIHNSNVDEFHGTVETSADLGLPALPGDSDYTALLSGTHTVRVWQDGADKSRASLMGEDSETTVVRNGDDVWQWSSKDKTAKHATVPEHEGESGKHAGDTTPQQAAKEILAAVEPSTEVTVTDSERVAGRPAYVLVLEPKSDQTLVERATIAVDSETSTPLRVQVFASGTERPAISVGYRSVDFTAPDPSVFDFTPPSGATVEEVTPEKHPDKKHEKSQPEPTTVGEGWNRVTVMTMPPMPPPSEPCAKPTDLEQWLDQLPEVSGSWGKGKVVKTNLATAVLTDDGRLAFGLVPVDTVVDAIS